MVRRTIVLGTGQITRAYLQDQIVLALCAAGTDFRCIAARGGRARCPGQGRSGGFRVLLAYRAKTRSVFLFGFAKNVRGNVEDDELATAQEIARVWLEADSKALAKALADGIIQEVDNGKEEND
jgi:RelE toxin of RelEB toxin-antitoxin system